MKYHGRLNLKKSTTCLLMVLVAISAPAQVLDALIVSALSSHPAVQSQRAQVDSALAGLAAARWQFYPTPSVVVESANSSAADRSYPGDSTVTSLRLQQPVWTGGRLSAGVAKSQAGVSVNRAALEEARVQLALRVVQAYGEWLAAHLKALAQEKSLATHARLREQVARRIEQGVSAQSDMLLAVARLETLAAEIAALRSQHDIAVARLGQLIGRPADPIALAQAPAVPRPVPAGIQSLLDQAQRLSPAIQKAQAQANAQLATIDERRAELAPEVYLRAERQYGNYSYRNASPENRLFLGLSSRFGAGLSSLSNVEAAQAQHQAALADIEVQSRALNEQVLADHALASSTQGRLAALKASLDAAVQVSESYDRQFLAGRKTWLDVMNAARELAQTELQLADIASAQVVLSWRLAILTQGLAGAVAGSL